MVRDIPTYQPEDVRGATFLEKDLRGGPRWVVRVEGGPTWKEGGRGWADFQIRERGSEIIVRCPDTQEQVTIDEAASDYEVYEALNQLSLRWDGSQGCWMHASQLHPSHSISY